MSLRSSSIMYRKIIKGNMRHYISIDLKSNESDILKIKLGSTHLDTQYMNKATMETIR